MHPSSSEQGQPRRRIEDIHYSAVSNTPAIFQKSSTKRLQIEEGQKHKETIDVRDCGSRMKTTSNEKTQTKRHSLGTFNLSCPPRSVALPASPITRQQKMGSREVICSLSSRVLVRHETGLLTNQRRENFNKEKSEENGKLQKVVSLVSSGRKHGMSRPVAKSGKGILKNRKQREEETAYLTDASKNCQNSNPTTIRFKKLSGEEKRSNLDRRIQTFNQSLDAYKKKEASKETTVESPSHNNNSSKTDSPRSISLPLLYQSYSDRNIKSLSASDQNSFETLRHCRYLRIPAPPELTIMEIFRHDNNDRIVNDSNSTK